MEWSALHTELTQNLQGKVLLVFFFVKNIVELRS